MMILTYQTTNCRRDSYYDTIRRAMDLNSEVEKIKKELVDLIVLKLKENQMDVPTARKLASDFLGLLPVKDQRDLLEKLKQLGENYSSVKELYLAELEEVREMEREEALTQMRNAITLGNMDHAIMVANQMKERSVI